MAEQNRFLAELRHQIAGKRTRVDGIRYQVDSILFTQQRKELKNLPPVESFNFF